MQSDGLPLADGRDSKTQSKAKIKAILKGLGIYTRKINVQLFIPGAAERPADAAGHVIADFQVFFRTCQQLTVLVELHPFELNVILVLKIGHDFKFSEQPFLAFGVIDRDYRTELSA